MPLSEHEQKLLDQMERALYSEDPSFASQMKGATRPTSRGRLLVGLLIALVGLAVVLLGVTLASIPVGVLGFLVMVAGVVWAASPGRRLSGPTGVVGSPRQGSRAAGPGGSRPARGRTQSGTFMQRVEERWDRRRNSGF